MQWYPRQNDRKHAHQNKTDRDRYIRLLLAACRTTEHPATGLSPNKLMFGREVNMPADLLYSFPKSVEPKVPHDFVIQLRDETYQTYHLERKSVGYAANRQKRDNGTRIDEHIYAVSDAVYEHRDSDRKQKAKYDGAIIVTKVGSPSIYDITDRGGSAIIHHDRLKPFRRNPPTKMDQIRGRKSTKLEPDIRLANQLFPKVNGTLRKHGER